MKKLKITVIDEDGLSNNKELNIGDILNDGDVELDIIDNTQQECQSIYLNKLDIISFYNHLGYLIKKSK